MKKENLVLILATQKLIFIKIILKWLNFL